MAHLNHLGIQRESYKEQILLSTILVAGPHYLERISDEKCYLYRYRSTSHFETILYGTWDQRKGFDLACPGKPQIKDNILE